MVITTQRKTTQGGPDAVVSAQDTDDSDEESPAVDSGDCAAEKDPSPEGETESQSEDEDIEPAQDQHDKTTDSSPSWRKRLRRAGLPVVLVVALGACGFLGWKIWQTQQLAQAGQQAQQAAIAYAQALTSVDSNNVDQNFRQVLDGATGEFKDMYTQSSVQLRQLLIDNKATAHGVVVDSAVQSCSADRAVVLMFIDQTVTNSQLPDPRMDRSRIKMTMEKVNGRWLASKVQLL